MNQPEQPHERLVPYVGSFVWLFFIVLPLVDALGEHGPALRAFAIAGAGLFVVMYIVLVVVWRRRARAGEPLGRLPVALLVCLYALGVAMTLGDNAGWGFLFTYCAAMAALMLPRLGLAAVAATALLAAVSSALGGASSGTTLGYVVSAAGIGLLMLGMRDLRERNRELFRARAELARLAVAEERQRFARDLHDLLGHSLSVIALKAELAGRLLPARPDDAAREIAQLEQVARSALGEVREAVSGYRELTLDGELAGARMALSAAGIETSVEVGSLELPGEAEAVLAWAVREGATNVIRHSGARRCVFRVGRGEWGGAELEMVDDGVGTDAPVAAGEGGVGHGLRGLAERVGALQGTLEAGSGVGGGFRLAVRIPVSPGGSRL